MAHRFSQMRQIVADLITEKKPAVPQTHEQSSCVKFVREFSIGRDLLHQRRSASY